MYCIPPPNPPVNGSVLVKNSGLYFGKVCPGRGGSAEDLPMVGCSGYNMKVQYDRTDVGSAGRWQPYYTILVNSIVGSPTFVFLMTFSRPPSLNLNIKSSQVSHSGGNTCSDFNMHCPILVL